MSTMNLSRMFNPESVAVIGASERGGSVGESLMRNLVSGTLNKDVFPVNPNYDNIMGIPAVSCIADIPQPVDLAVIATPIQQVPDIVRACGDKGISGAVVISAGGKETGIKGKEIEARIKHAAAQSGIRIIGPNCLGIANTQTGLNASFMHQFPLPGRMAFLSQSGAVCTSVLDLSLKENVGFSHFISLGSMLDVDFADMIDYLGAQSHVDSIILYMETMTNIRNFMSAARAVSRIKPIIALKSGRSAAGAKAAASHTGALAGEDSVYDAAFKRAGILRVNEFDELFNCAEFLAKQPRPKGGRLAIITNAGGPGVMAVDALSHLGLTPAELSEGTIQALDTALQKQWSRANPVDILGDSSPEQYIRAADICSRAPGVDGLLMICSPVGTFDPCHLADPLSRFLTDVRCPVFTTWIGGSRMDRARSIFNANGVITYDTPEKAVRAFANLYQYGRNIDMLHEIPVRKDKNLVIDRDGADAVIRQNLAMNRTFMNEHDAKNLLACYGIPVNRTALAADADEAGRMAAEIGFPVALKVSSEDIIHKSDAGGVILNLTHADAVKDGFHTIMENAARAFPEADIAGVSVQAMAPAPDYELIVGAKRDSQFGPVILFGMGGVMTEIYRDSALSLPPLNHALAREAILRTRISRVLKGFRHIKPVRMSQVEEILIRVSRLVTDFPEIRELDINPLMVRDGELTGVDARIQIEKTSQASPAHLIISPYPAWQETECLTAANEKVFIRPVIPSDAHPMISFFSDLSPQSIYYRFFSPIKQLSKEMLIKFTQIDYDREVALVALTPSSLGEKMIGVARIIFLPDGKTGEFAIILADYWHGKGVGAALLKRCLAFSKKCGLKTVYGLVMNENTQMIKLGKKLGFTIRRDPDSYDIELSIDLDTLDMMIDAA